MKLNHNLFIVLGLIGGLISCGQGNKTQLSGQVVAKVNDDEITIHQLNYEITQLKLKPGTDVAQVAPKVLEQIVNRQLFVQKAIDLKLDRTPEVLQSLENAKAKILANAYLVRLTSTGKEPTDKDIKDYYDAHPEQFANRRIYQFEQLAVSSDGISPDLETKLAEAKDLQEVATWLEEQKIQFRLSKNVRAAEQMPADVAKKMYEMKTGQGALIKGQSGYIILKLLAFKDEPYDFEAAKPAINRILVGNIVDELTKSELKRLRAESSIRYSKEYENTVSKAESNLSIPDETAAPKQQ